MPEIDTDAVTLERSATTPVEGQPRRRRIAVAGSSGLIGRGLVAALRKHGCDVLRLVRRESRDQDEIEWDPQRGTLDPERTGRFERLDAIVNLAGRGIADARWSAEVKRELVDSRVEGARTIGRAVANLKKPPRVWINASAIGYYGDRGAEPLDETGGPGSGFLAMLCQAWESAVTAPAGVRVVFARFGVVLSPAGGALGKMLPAFRFGLGARLGNGRQYMSWIGRDDAVGALVHMLRSADLAGPVNVVAPQPVTNAEFTKTLGRVLRRPAFAAIPAAVVSLVFGEMGRETVLAGSYVVPRALERSGFVFGHPRLEPALRHELERVAAKNG